MTEIPDDEVEAAAKALERAHWNGEGCGTNGPSGCLYCYGPSPADSREIAKMILAAVRPRWEKQLAEAYRYNASAHREMMQLEAERDAARVELERMRAATNALVGATLDLHPVYGNTSACGGGVGGATITEHCAKICQNPRHDAARDRYDDALNAVYAALRPVPEQGRP